MNTADIMRILDCLPHRYPFLLIDRVLTFTPNSALQGIKNVTYNEPYFQGHFPQQPIMPGVLIIEALAQATGVLAFLSAEQTPDGNSMYYLVGIDKTRFKRPVVPGDQLILDVSLQRIRRDIGVFSAQALVAEQTVASAELMCARRPMLTHNTN